MYAYSKLADALDSMTDEAEAEASSDEEAEGLEDVMDPSPHHRLIPAISVLSAISSRAYAYLDDIPQHEIVFSTPLVMGERSITIPGRYTPPEAHARPEVIVLPFLRHPYDFVTTPCKHECAMLKKSRHVSQAREV
jgi:hypothetical protein